MAEWGAIRMRTAFGQIYVTRTEADFAYLKRRPREDGEPRVVFTLSELKQLFEDCEEKNLSDEQRLEFFAEIRAIKLETSGSFEKIGAPEEFPEGDVVSCGDAAREFQIVKERRMRASERPRAARGDKQEPKGTAGERTAPDDAGNLGFTY